MSDSEIPIQVRSILGSDTGNPYVAMEIDGQEVFKVPVVKAREIAGMLLEAAEAAIGDAFFLTFLTDQIEIDLKRSMDILREYRRWRREHRVDEPL